MPITMPCRCGHRFSADGSASIHVGSPDRARLGAGRHPSWRPQLLVLAMVAAALLYVSVNSHHNAAVQRMVVSASESYDSKVMQQPPPLPPPPQPPPPPQQQQQQEQPQHQQQQQQHQPQSLCSRLASIFRRLPPSIELPLSTDDAQQDEGAFAGFTLARNLSLAQRGSKAQFSMYVYSSNDSVSRNILHNGHWEKPLIGGVLKQLREFAEVRGLQPEEVYFVDIGANIGTYTLQAALSGFRVIAFEPMYSNAMAIQFSMCANPGIRDSHVTLINKGLGEKATNCTLFSKGANIGDGTLRCGSHFTVPYQGIERFRLDVVRLDDVLAASLPELRGRVGAVKMDVEGHETLVVAGGLEFFREVSAPYIVAECDTKMILGAAGVTPGHFFQQMVALGYTVYDGAWQAIHAQAFSNYTCKYATVYFRKS